MHQINLSDQIYQNAQRRAAEAGFASVDEFVADLLARELDGATPDLDHFFTSERLTLIDESLAGAKAANVLTMEQAKAELAKSRDSWMSDHPHEKSN